MAAGEDRSVRKKTWSDKEDLKSSLSVPLGNFEVPFVIVLTVVIDYDMFADDIIEFVFEVSVLAAIINLAGLQLNKRRKLRKFVPIHVKNLLIVDGIDVKSVNKGYVVGNL